MHPHRAIFAITSLALTGALLPACTQSAPQSAIACAEPFYVPTTLILQPPESRPSRPAFANYPSPLAIQVLAAADYEESYFPRGEKFIYGSTPVEAVSSYSVLTYDIQRISARNLGGYRYTWDVKSGVSVP